MMIMKRKLTLSQLLALCGLVLFSHLSLAKESAQAGKLTPPEELTRAIALSADVKQGQKIYRLCANCHMQNGWGKRDGSFPVIAGQHKNVLIKQLEDIRSKNRNNPTMYPFTEPGSIGGLQGIADVTAYIATLPVDPNPGTGDGKHLAEGKRIYQQHCLQCHGDNALGDNENFYPRLKGQHYAYLLRQLEWIGNGYRKNANPVMITQVKTLSKTELAAVADYLSRL